MNQPIVFSLMAKYVRRYSKNVNKHSRIRDLRNQKLSEFSMVYQVRRQYLISDDLGEKRPVVKGLWALRVTRAHFLYFLLTSTEDD